MKVIRYLLYFILGLFTNFALDLSITDWRWWVLLVIVLGIDAMAYFSDRL